jgi:CheY-like chemotaxis protein
MMENGGMPDESPQRRERCVLIVDDSESASATLEMAALAIPGVAVRTVASAPEALRVLDAMTAPVDAVITDLNLPRMDGYELIERLRAGGPHRHAPIVVVSGETDPAAPERVRRLGADAFFAKPFSPAAVREKLEQLFNVASD